MIPQCASNQCDVMVYWTLMKGLLAGRIGRDHVFAAGDSRPNYEIFQGEARRKTHDILDDMQRIGRDSGRTIAQLSIGWALAQSGVTQVLVGARRESQVTEIAASVPLPADLVAAIDQSVQTHLPEIKRSP